MFKKMILSLIIFLVLIAPKPTFAETEFSSSYDVTYEVNAEGQTTVTEKITLKNLTERYYASTFNKSIGITKLTDVEAKDDANVLQTEVTKAGNKTNIKVNFSKQVVGKGKEYKFTLKYKSPDFAEKQGKIWQVAIPKIVTSSPDDNYSLTLSVPVSFSDPTSIVPEPNSHSETGGKLNYRFLKSQLENQGILANFGSEQLFHFVLKFNLENNSLLPTFERVPLPPQTNYQEVSLESLTPLPENVILDVDNNFIALFKLEPKTKLEASVSGLAKLSINPKKQTLSEKQFKDLIQSKQYWDKDNPLIKARLREIFAQGEPEDIKQKASLINQFVVNHLKYNSSRVQSNNFERLGALTTLNNPDNALCMEFSDLFITLSRAANIPSRQLLGFAYSSNIEIRPLSFDSEILHAWVEYYDPNSGWVMVDPTWQNTSGGVDYFNKIDLNHFVLSIRGEDSLSPTTTNNVKVEFSNAIFNPAPKLTLGIESKDEFSAGFPAKFKINLKNQGSTSTVPGTLNITSSKITLNSGNSYYIPAIAPFGSYQLELSVKPSALWESYQDILQVSMNDFKASKSITVKPIFGKRLFFPFVLGTGGILVALLYLSLLYFHHRSNLKYQNVARYKKPLP